MKLLVDSDELLAQRAIEESLNQPVPCHTTTRVVNAQVSDAIIDSTEKGQEAAAYTHRVVRGHLYRSFLSSAPRRTVATDGPEQQLTAGFADAVILRD